MPSLVIAMASFDDLLLVTPCSRACQDYYICNPLTKQWFELFKASRDCPITFALVYVPNNSNKPLRFSMTNTLCQYKVTLIHREDGDNDSF